LGAQQSRLGSQQAALARAATARLQALADDAIRRGLARQVD
jgi:hypothetical protein